MNLDVSDVRAGFPRDATCCIRDFIRVWGSTASLAQEAGFQKIQGSQSRFPCTILLMEGAPKIGSLIFATAISLEPAIFHATVWMVRILKQFKYLNWRAARRK